MPSSKPAVPPADVDARPHEPGQLFAPRAVDVVPQAEQLPQRGRRDHPAWGGRARESDRYGISLVSV